MLLHASCLLLSALAAAPNLLDELDARLSRGEMDEATFHRYRVAALRDPEQLPADLMAMPLGKESHGRMTAIGVEAFQWARRHPVEGEAIRHMLLPEPDLKYVLDSTSLPIRVSYQNSYEATLAREVLQSTEQAWRVLTTEWGWYTPPIEPGTERYRVFVKSTGGHGSAYTLPYGDNPDTPRSDCFTYIVFDPNNSTSEAAGTMAHELNHATQAAMDCNEVIAFWENTATYIMGKVTGEGNWFMTQVIPDFQHAPWRSIGAMSDGDSAYEYGGSLFPLYLTSAYGTQDGPVMMRQIWEAAMQEGTYENTKTYFEAIAEVVNQRGGPADFDTVFTDFSEARLFVGSQDDGAHMPGASQLRSCEVSQVLTFQGSNLPSSTQQPAAAKQPAPYGVNYFTISMGLSPVDVKLNWMGDLTRWVLRAFLAGGLGAAKVVPLTVDPQTLQVNTVIKPEGRSKIHVMVANLGDGTFNPTRAEYPVTAYYFQLSAVRPPPTVTGINPGSLAQGQTGVATNILGTNFFTTSGITVAVNDPEVHVDSVSPVSATSVRVVFTVTAQARLGAHDLTVTNPDGQSATGTGVLTITPGEAPDAGTPDAGGQVDAGSTSSSSEPGDDDDDDDDDTGPVPGCACVEAPSSAAGGMVLLSWCVFLALSSRRRARNRPSA